MANGAEPGRDVRHGTFYEVAEPHKTLHTYEQSYDSLYDRYKEDKIRALMDSILAPGMRVIEIGCGGGRWTRYFVGKAVRLTVIEREQHLIEAARHSLREASMDDSSVEFIAADASSWSGAGSMDIVFAKDVIEHIEDDEGFLRNVAEQLSEGGRLFLSTQNAWSLNYLIEGTYQRWIKRRHRWMGWDPTHLRFYHYRRLRQMLMAVGLTPRRWVGAYHLPYRILGARFEHPRWHVLERLGGYCFPWSILGWNIGVLASKNPCVATHYGK